MKGYLIIGFPNLAALHCRIQLMLGKQPSFVKIDDAHVRGFTKADFLRVINTIEGLEIVSFSGANMYVFPSSIARKLAHIFPNLSVSLLFLIRKTKNDVDVIKFWRESNLETNYYVGQ